MGCPIIGVVGLQAGEFHVATTSLQPSPIDDGFHVREIIPKYMAELFRLVKYSDFPYLAIFRQPQAASPDQARRCQEQRPRTTEAPCFCWVLQW